MDILGPFPCSKLGKRYILVVNDHLTRYPEAFALATIYAPVIAQVFYDEVVCRHGVPSSLLTDRGFNFLSIVMMELSGRT